MSIDSRLYHNTGTGVKGWSLFALAVVGVIALATVALGQEDKQAGAKVTTGVLECYANPSVGWVIGSTRSLQCTFKPSQGEVQHYRGTQKRFGVDIGVRDRATLVWAVLSPTSQVGPGELAGGYRGVSGDVALGLGIGVHALIGGNERSFTLQPFSVEGQVGVNFAIGVSKLTLE